MPDPIRPIRSSVRSEIRSQARSDLPDPISTPSTIRPLRSTPDPNNPIRSARSPIHPTPDPPAPIRLARFARSDPLDPMCSIRSARCDAQLDVRRGLGAARREMPRKMCRRPSRAGGGQASRDCPRVRARAAAAHRDDRRGGGATTSHSRWLNGA